MLLGLGIGNANFGGGDAAGVGGMLGGGDCAGEDVEVAVGSGEGVGVGDGGGGMIFSQ
jgi:hypothetical protein